MAWPQKGVRPSASLHIPGLGGATLVCATLPFHAQKASVLLGAVALLGIFCGVAFGSSYQLVSRFSARESVALTTGDSTGAVLLECGFPADCRV